jgi:hypothetical protein
VFLLDQQVTPQIFLSLGWNSEPDAQSSTNRKTIVQKWVEEVYQPDFIRRQKNRGHLFYEFLSSRYQHFHFPETVEVDGQVQYRGWRMVEETLEYTEFAYCFDLNGRYLGLQTIQRA